jgi:hypothetical protein
MSAVPPPIDTSGTFPIGLGKRETAVLLCGIVVIIFLFALPMPFFVKLGASVVVGGLAALIAFGRGQGGRKAEDYITGILGFSRRDRLMQRGATRIERTAPDAVFDEGKAPDQFWLQDRRGDREDTVLKLPALPLGYASILSVFAAGFLAMLLGWIWSGGLQVLSVWLDSGL